MNCNCLDVRALPDIEMYGGDNTPWEVVLIDGTSTPVPYEYGSLCSAKLTLIPFKFASGISMGSTPLAPVLEIDGAPVNNGTGGTVMVFQMNPEDTRYLRGKYTYQVELRYHDNARVAQGTVYIRRNIYHSASMNAASTADLIAIENAIAGDVSPTM